MLARDMSPNLSNCQREIPEATNGRLHKTMFWFLIHKLAQPYQPFGKKICKLSYLCFGPAIYSKEKQLSFGQRITKMHYFENHMEKSRKHIEIIQVCLQTRNSSVCCWKWWLLVVITPISGSILSHETRTPRRHVSHPPGTKDMGGFFDEKANSSFMHRSFGSQT